MSVISSSHAGAKQNPEHPDQVLTGEACQLTLSWNCWGEKVEELINFWGLHPLALLISSLGYYFLFGWERPKINTHCQTSLTILLLLKSSETVSSFERLKAQVFSKPKSLITCHNLDLILVWILSIITLSPEKNMCTGRNINFSTYLYYSSKIILR